MKLAQYNSPGNWYDVVLAGPDQNGTYPITSVTLEATIGFGPEGIIYVSDSNPQFSAASVLVSEYSGGSVSTYEIDSNGDPVVATRRVFLSGLTGAEGAVVDPLTGDFLFSTYGGGNRVIVVKGFVPPPSTTTTTTSTTTPTTTTSTTISPTTTSSTTVITTTSSSTTTVITSSTTSTTAPAGCAQVPPGATLASVVCRLAALRDATAGATGLGSLREKSLVTLSKAIERTDEAVDICGGNDVKKARSRLKQVRRHLIQFSHRLRANSARKKAPPGVREPLADEADSISADSKAVRAALACPGAAAGIP
jgi:hypothetical protein